MAEIAEIEVALKQFRERSERYALYRRYYDGDHRLAFATDKFRNAFGALFRAFADNLCPAVVDAAADRLRILGIESEEPGAAVAEAAWAIWQANRMDQRAGQAHVEALLSGDSYVIVWPDAAGNPTIYPQAGAAVTVYYDAETPGVILWGAKQWLLEDGRMRLNMYYPERIEKWVTLQKVNGLPARGGAFAEYSVGGEPWPLPNPWGVVPIFHLPNNAGMEDFGHSELRNVIPLQDALNKAIADMLVAMEYVALPQRWVTGLEVPLDEATGQPQAPFAPGIDRVWSVGAPDARFGQFSSGDLAQFLKVQEGFRAEIARVSGTPLHYLLLQAGEFPSGEAMKTAEARFLAKVQDRQVTFGNCWENALTLALRMAGHAERVRLSVQWQDPTPHSEREQVEVALVKQQLGVSRQQVLTELGYSPQEIGRMDVERTTEQQQLGEAMLQAFDRDAVVGEAMLQAFDRDAVVGGD